MFCALFGVLAAVNLQSAGMVVSSVPFLFALPSFCVSELYPLKASLCASLAMAALSFILGSLESFLLVSPFVLAGFVVGCGSRKGLARGLLLIVSTLILGLAAFLQTTLFAVLFGYSMADLEQEFFFLKGILRPVSILFASSFLLGFLQALILILLGWMLERRLPQYFRLARPLQLWHPPGWIVWSTLMTIGLLIFIEFGLHMPFWIHDGLLLGFVLEYGILVYAGWLALISIKRWKPVWHLMLSMGMWIFPVNLFYVLYGAYQLAFKSRYA